MYCIQTIVIKIGSAVLTNPDKSLNDKILIHLVEQIAKLHKEGHQVLMVTSGAVASGRNICDFSDEKRRQVRRQMYAGLGQANLMRKYHEAFAKHQITIAQCLLNRDNFADREEYQNMINTLEGFLRFRVIPILNENDLLSHQGTFGGNDLLAALSAISIKADKLVILSDIASLYDKDPRQNPEAKAIHVVERVTEEIESMCGGSSSSVGLGGMISKVRAIKIATESGIPTFLGRGTDKNILHEVVDTKNPVGTYFKAQKVKNSRFKDWLKYCSLPKGTVVVDDGAATALKKHKSLLMVGIRAISDGIESKDTVYIVNTHNEPVGSGKINYSSQEVKGAINTKKNLGVVIHCDNLTIR